MKCRPGAVDLTQIVQDTVNDRSQGCFPSSCLLDHIKRSPVRHIQDRLDRKQRSHQSRSVRHPTAGFQVIEIIHGKAVSNFQLVFLTPGNYFIETRSRFHALDHFFHQQTKPAGDAVGVHHIELLLGIFRTDPFCSLVGIHKRDRHLSGHIEEDDIFSGIQQLLEEIVVDELIDHGGFKPVSRSHSGVHGSAGFFPAVILAELVIHGVGIGNKRNIVTIQPGPRKIRSGRCRNEVVRHVFILSFSFLSFSYYITVSFR